MRSAESSRERGLSNSKGRVDCGCLCYDHGADEGDGRRPASRLTLATIMSETLIFTRQLPGSANRDFISLFDEQASGHVLKYFYLYPSDDDTDLLPKQNRYYVFNEDVRLIQELCNAHATRELNFTNLSTIVDLGPGDINAFLLKVKPITDILSKFESYIAVDYSLRVLTELRNSLYSLGPDHFITFICGDFQSMYPCKLSIQNSAVLMLGHTLGSLPVYKQGYFPDLEYVNFLKGLRECFPEGTQFLFTLDCCMDWKEVLDCYSSDLTYRFFQRGYSEIFNSKDRFPSEIFETEIRIDPGASCICFDLHVSRDVTIHFWDRSITVLRDRRFTLGTSYRFSLEKAISFLRRAGFLSTQHIQLPGSHVALLLAKS